MTSTSSLSRRPNRSPLLRWRVASERFLRPARQSPRKPAVKPSGRLMFKPGRLAVCRAPSTANSRTCHHEPSTRPSPACARSSVLTRKQPPIQPKSTVLGLNLDADPQLDGASSQSYLGVRLGLNFQGHQVESQSPAERAG